MSTFRLNGCFLTVVPRCPRCQRWAKDHTDEECARWRALRSDPLPEPDLDDDEGGPTT